MPSLVRDGSIVPDQWCFVEKTAPDYSEQVIVPLEQCDPKVHQAVWIEPDTQIQDYATELLQLDLIAIKFNTFADGRGLSLASLLRSRYGFKGEIRAFGDLNPDLTPFMHRSGFTTYLFDNEEQAETAIRCLTSYSDYYQASAIQPSPAYRRSRRS